MGVRLLRSAVCEGDPGPQPLKYASVNGRQLFHITAGWPELQTEGVVVGVYQGIGRERLQASEAITDLIEAYDGFDGFRPAAMIFDQANYGPFAHLTVARQCLGPFATLEGNELAGAMAVTTAIHDLQRGRCDLALVGAFERMPARSWLMLLGRDADRTLRCKTLWTQGHAQPSAEHLATLAEALGGPVRLLADRDMEADPLGCQAFVTAFEAVQAGERVAVWSNTPDGRGMLVGLGVDQ